MPQTRRVKLRISRPHDSGNPTALAALRAGETVLDLGSGGGIDVLLPAAPDRLAGWLAESTGST